MERLSEFKVCDEAFYFPVGNLRLRGRIWSQSTASARGTVIGVHGYSEHSDRYAHFADFLNRAGWNVAWFDLPGHGESDGQRSNIDDFSDYIRSLEIFTSEVEKRKLQRPFHLFAHSLGGLIATRFSQSSSYIGRFQSVTLSSPLFGLSNYPTWSLPFLEILTTLAPNITLPNSGELGSRVLSSDKRLMKNRDEDPLIRSQVTFHWLREFLRARRAAFKNIDAIRIPIGIFQAGDERVVSRPETERFGSLLKVKNVIRIYESLLHEVVNEITRDQVMRDILDWIEQNRGASE